MTEVIVGNIGSVLNSGDNPDSTFDHYVTLSREQIGRAAGESVYLMIDGEPVREYIGSQDLSGAARALNLIQALQEHINRPIKLDHSILLDRLGQIAESIEQELESAFNLHC